MLQKSATESDVRIESLGKGSYRLTTVVELPESRDKVFEFFADAGNLERITPEFLNFRILSSLPIEMKPGARIDYKIRLRGIPIKWRTNIAEWQPNEFFVDEQIRGPYRRWYHRHEFEPVEGQPGKTRMTDIVDYRVWLAPIFHPLMVKHDLIRIFEYRQQQILKLFGADE